jgi:glycerophosphoryl diester phosphodiesterase
VPPVTPHTQRIAHGYGNSPRYLALALEGPVDYIEADVWYQGGRVAVRHERKIGPLPILFDEKHKGHVGHGPGRYGLPLGRWYVKLQIRALYLENVLTLARGRRRILVDVKWSPGGRQSAFARALAQTVRLSGMADDVTFCGQNWPVLQRLRVIDPGLRVFYSIGAQRQLPAFGHIPQDETLQGVCVHQSLLNAQLIDILKRRGLDIWTWTVDEVEQARQLVSMGIDGIISNRLEVLEALSEAPAEPSLQG